MSDAGERKSFLVECYWPGVDEPGLRATVEQAEAATLELRRQGRHVEFIGSILIASDETVFCLFDGTETDVRAASTLANIPCERVLESVRIDGSQQPAPRSL